MFDTKVIAILIVFPSLYSLSSLWSAYHSFHCVGISKSARKKIRKSMKWWKKILLLYPVKYDSSYYKKSVVLRKIYYLLLIVNCLCVIVLLVTLLFSLANKVLFGCVAFKIILFDIPIALISFVFSKHGKNGGVVWRWEE